MDYKKKYEQALERAENLHKDAIDMGETLRAKQCEIIFPELAESEDERIRKELIEFVKSRGGFKQEYIDWLEKQESVGEIVARCKKSWYNEGKIDGKFEGIADDVKYQQGWHDALERQVHVDKEEDDRIRRHLIKHFGNKTKKDWNGVPVHSILTWLEKQGEKPQGKSAFELWKDMRSEAGAQASGNRHEPPMSDNDSKLFSLNDIDDIMEIITEKQGEKPQGKSALEAINEVEGGNRYGIYDTPFEDESITTAIKDFTPKQGEKSINDTDDEIVEAVKDTSVLDMVELKFKVGDWIISNNGDCVGQIIDFSEDNFFWCEHTNGYFSGCFKKDYHLWTLKDAKRGDVLSSNSSVFLFQRENTAGKPTAYCGIVNGCFLQGQGACWTNEQCHPATKEQRDLLFSKMEEAGYKWDIEKKELKKIESKFHEGDWISGYYTNYKVAAINSKGYVVEDTDGNKINILFENEKFHHLWTIEDAKNGDVLVTSSGIVFLFQKIMEGGTISFYAALSTSNFSSNTKIHIPNDNEQLGDQDVFPATKEQRDLLFLKMKEAGYEWGDENKKLKKIESKFHEGDWIITNKNHIWYVDETPETTSYLYRLINQYGKVEVAEFEIVDKKARLWTIQDAKDGDVLVTDFEEDNTIVMYHSMCTKDTINVHCCLDNKFTRANLGVFDVEDVKPATKEQRDILFQKMRESGYEWDADKKELKKIEDEEYNGDDYGIDSLYHAISILEKTLGEVEGYQSDDGILEHKCAITAVKKLYKKKPAEWSEEDERILVDCFNILHRSDYPRDKVAKTVNWLKSLKERMKN